MDRLYVSDLDGTLLDSDGRLSPFARRSLHELLGAGLQFTVASARSATSIRHILGDLPLRLPIIEFNGAYLTDYASTHPLYCESLSQALGRQVWQWCTDLDLEPCCSTFAQGRQRLYPPARVGNAGMQWLIDERRAALDPRIQPPSAPERIFEDAVVCLSVVAKRATLERLRQTIEQTFPGQSNQHLFVNPYQRDWHWLTVQSPLANKGRALELLAQRAAIPLDQTVVFGDEANDLPMFRKAGHAIAVANALPNVRDEADLIIGPHQTDSVVHYLLPRKPPQGLPRR